MSELVLLHRFPGRKSRMNSLAWSPDGMMLAANYQSSPGAIQLLSIQTKESETLIEYDTPLSCPTWTSDSKTLIMLSADQKIKYWDRETGEFRPISTEYDQWATCLACSPRDDVLASGSSDGTIRLWDARTGQHRQTLSGHYKPVSCLAWSSDGEILASGSSDKDIKLWTRNKRSEDWQLKKTLVGHLGAVTSLVWLPEKNLLISGSEDKTLRVWDSDTGQEMWILEGHTATITSLSSSYDGSMFASQANDIRLWSTETWQSIITPLPVWKSSMTVPEDQVSSMVAFRPYMNELALLDKANTEVTINSTYPLRIVEPSQLGSAGTRYYTNAKVVLIGDTGVGKTALGYALMRLGFRLTESTHNRTIWSFHTDRTKREDETVWHREIFLWDLAGQTSYRLIHQLHLNNVSVALVLFDARSETDPFAGVGYWRRALRQAESHNTVKLAMKRFLVSARIDRGGPMVTQGRIDAFVQSHGGDERSPNFDGYYETSAKENIGIEKLAEAIKRSIDWDQLLTITSPNLFQHIKTFLLTEKGAGHLLARPKELYQIFLERNLNLDQPDDLYEQFQVCIQLLEAQGLIRRFTFGDLVLLQPELLDSYAAALINEVRQEPDGLGHILEEDVKKCNFFIPPDVRILDKDDEHLLVIAMVEDLVKSDIALREFSDEGTFLVFPAQSTLEFPDMPDPGGKAVVFKFEGPVLNIYATLAVRLSHSGFFKKVNQWKNAITYTTRVPVGEYGIILNNFEDGRAELTLFFDTYTTEEMRFHFEKYIEKHLERGVAPNPLYRRRLFQCSNTSCGIYGVPLPESHVKARRDRGFNWLNCSVCGERVNLHDEEELLTAKPASLVLEMDSKADQNRDRSVAAFTLEGKKKTGDFDVFLCYNKADREEVEQLRELLHDQGILPWYDMEDAQPGRPLQEAVEQQIHNIKSAVVFVGKGGIGPWQNVQLHALLNEFANEFAKQERPIIPVILKQAPHVPEIPKFLETFSRVDFREGEQKNPMGRLIWGITGQRPENIFDLE